MSARAWVENVTFSDGTLIELGKDDVIVIVGPNNSGKSATLRGIHQKFSDSAAASLPIKSITVKTEGTADSLINWLNTNTTKSAEPNSNSLFTAFGHGVRENQARAWWTNNSSLHGLSNFFCHLLAADERLSSANPPGNISLARQAPQHPIHYLQRNDELEQRLSAQFRSAFGHDLIVHRNAGNEVPLHVGPRPKPEPGKDRLSLGYIEELEKLPTIHTQGDGMRSFAGVLLNTAIGTRTVLLIDEPEAFLHPPQARLLGKMMVVDAHTHKQLFISTHSGDVLRGVLDANSPNVRVIRIRRDGNVNIATQLNNSDVKKVWSDPLLRYSNILDGLFHGKVVVCEGDADCRFYAAVMDAEFDSDASRARPDIMFTHCGGKARLPVVIRAIRQLDVPMAVVADFDVLNEEQPLRAIVEATGGDWSAISADWKSVKNSIDLKKPERTGDEIKAEIQELLKEHSGNTFSPTIRGKIQAALKKSSPWSTAKSVGIPFVPNGEPTQACSRLLDSLKKFGVHVAPVGELEGFAKSVGVHGPSWVNEAIQKDLANDPELLPARTFVRGLIK